MTSFARTADTLKTNLSTLGQQVVTPYPTPSQGLSLSAQGTVDPKLLKGFPNDATKGLLGNGTWGSFGGLSFIANTTLSGTASSIAFSSIPSTYAHLLLVAQLGSDQAGSQTVRLKVNTDTGGDYDTQSVSGNASTASAAEAFAGTTLNVGNTGNSTALTAGGVVLFIPSYAGTTLAKMVMGLSADKTGTSTGNMKVQAVGGFWRSTSAVSALTLSPAAGNFSAGSQATLYGMSSA